MSDPNAAKDVKPPAPAPKPADPPKDGGEQKPPAPSPEPELKGEVEDAIKAMLDGIPKDKRKSIEKDLEGMDLKARYRAIKVLAKNIGQGESGGTGPIPVPGPNDKENWNFPSNPSQNKATVKNVLQWPDDTWAITSDAARKRFVTNLDKSIQKNTKNL